VPVSSYIVRIRRSAGSSTLSPFPEPGCRAVKGPVPSSHSRCYVTRIVAETGSESELKQGLLPACRCRHEEANDDLDSNEKGADKSGLSSCDHPPLPEAELPQHVDWYQGSRQKRSRLARLLRRSMERQGTPYEQHGTIPIHSQWTQVRRTSLRACPVTDIEQRRIIARLPTLSGRYAIQR
jgi:hypothetical protein